MSEGNSSFARAEWTGKYPTLCQGEWHLYIDGVDRTDVIPEDLRNESMDTFKEYDMWRAGENNERVWRKYEDGLDEDEWIEENDWIESVATEDWQKKAIYEAFNEHDWRHLSCGGCE